MEERREIAAMREQERRDRQMGNVKIIIIIIYIFFYHVFASLCALDICCIQFT